jgi:hypothetical protein
MWEWCMYGEDVIISESHEFERRNAGEKFLQSHKPNIIIAIIRTSH